MKIFTTLFSAGLLLCACTTDITDETVTRTQPGTNTVQTTVSEPNEELFATPDKSADYSTNPALCVRYTLSKADVNRATSMGETSITDEQYAEIKAFVDENLKADKPYDTYRNIFKWITSNIKYAWEPPAYLDPYEVFKEKRCVCQGYANLLKTMCLTQGIPACVANGMLGTAGGHAWNYVYIGDKWYVSDPTNNQDFEMISDLSKYQKKLIPHRLDITLFEDDNFAYNFQDQHLNVSEVKTAPNAYISVPFSTNKLRVTSFHPTKAIPSNVTQIYLGENRKTLGDYTEELSRTMPHVEEIFVAAGNKKLSSYKGVVYQGANSTSPYYVPAGVTRLELKPMKVVEKNTVYYLDNLEELIIPEGTESIEAYAVEQCPNLKRIYIPESLTDIAENAFSECGNYEIVRVPTGIHEVMR